MRGKGRQTNLGAKRGEDLGAGYGVAVSAGITISFVAGSSATADSDSIEVSMPTGTTEGDIMIALVSTDAADQTFTSDGWTQQEQAVVSGACALNVLYKEAGEGETGPYTFAGTTSTDLVGIIGSFRASGGTTWALSDQEATEASENTITSTSITLSSGDALIACWGNDDNEDVDTPPTDMTTVIAGDEVKSTNNAGAMHYQLSMSAGGVTKSITWGGVAEELTSIVIGLNRS